MSTYFAILSCLVTIVIYVAPFYLVLNAVIMTIAIRRSMHYKKRTQCSDSIPRLALFELSAMEHHFARRLKKPVKQHPQGFVRRKKRRDPGYELKRKLNKVWLTLFGGLHLILATLAYAISSVRGGRNYGV